MQAYPLLLALHVLGACVWVGGHLVLSLGVLPDAWRRRDPAPVRAFEARFERVGLPALLIQVASGAWLAAHWLGSAAAWHDTGSGLTRAVWLKLALLAMTVLLALHARLRLIPRLSPRTVPLLGLHIVAVTVVSVVLLAVGVSFRFGGLR
ncbi:MAG: CopD family protein [Proteobacteria bacterium]|nr:CopD family protein [Pseudomonadota bacterium]